MSDQPTKRCVKCEQELPATAEYFKEKRYGQKLMLSGACLECLKAYRRTPEYRATRKDYDRDYHQSSDYKTSRTSRRQTPKYKEWRKAYRQTSEQKAHEKAYGDIYSHSPAGRVSQKRHRDSPEYKAKLKAYRQTPEYKAYEKARQQTARYKATRMSYEQTPERKAARRSYGRSAATKARMTAYRHSAEGHFIIKASKQRRAARLRALPQEFTDADWNTALNYFDHRCAVCGRPQGLWHTLAADHWIPLSDVEHCPGTIPTNIVPLCHGAGGCNNSKHNRDPIEWLNDKLGKHAGREKLAEIEAYFSSIKDRNAAPLESAGSSVLQ